ncbi:MAG: carbonic anhydrase [Bdellovibrio sp.]
MRHVKGAALSFLLISFTCFANSEAPKTDAHHASENSVPAGKALKWLQNGNTRYLNGFLRRDGISSKDRKTLNDGQHPHAVVLSCSDSRVPPEIVFDQKLGELFTVRTAGETLDSSVLASIEYAVSHLGPQLIVVMGHTKCGAVKAAIETKSGEDAGSENLNKLVSDIHPRLESLKRLPASADYYSESWANAKGVAADLAKRSKIIEQKLKEGQLKIVPALYHLDSGKVEW